MKTRVKVKRADLLEIVATRLRKAENEHKRAAEAYPDKLAAWQADAIARLEKALEAARKGKFPEGRYGGRGDPPGTFPRCWSYHNRGGHGMRYLWSTAPGLERRVMHIEAHDRLGNELMRPLCSVRLPFNRTINAPFGLGRPVCKRCRSLAASTSATGEDEA